MALPTPLDRIRNFSIIAHIDHGKSTLSDRLIQHCGGLSEREMSQQVLDSMDLERERGITIKAQCVTLNYQSPTRGHSYQLNLIDTPGHVDFAYEVSRSLAACEGALLVVDASQGVEAQTVANCYTALELGLTVMPVLNKIDLPTADPHRVAREIEDIIGLNGQDAVLCSAKTGQGIPELLEQLVQYIPSPLSKSDASIRSALSALIIDSWFDSYLGVIALVRIYAGCLQMGEKITFMNTHQSATVESLGIFTPKRANKSQLNVGEVGWIACGIKTLNKVAVGDTITRFSQPAPSPLPGFKKIQPQVYAGLFPVQTEEFNKFRTALEKLSLNDSALSFEPETSSALGFGFRCGFLGLLHMEVVQERLEREYELDLIATAPSVLYRVTTLDQSVHLIENPTKFPDANQIASIEEPIGTCHILVPPLYLGQVMQICSEKRGRQIDITHHAQQVALTYDIPMNEVISDLFDQLKSASRGYASLEYRFKAFEIAQMIRLDLLINQERLDAFSLLLHKSQARHKAQLLVDKLAAIIPRQQFDINIQAAIGNQILTRATIKQYRKNVTGKCYGGDITRKQKLLKKQKAGKKRLKQIGKIELPKESFLAILNLKSN